MSADPKSLLNFASAFKTQNGACPAGFRFRGNGHGSSLGAGVQI